MEDIQLRTKSDLQAAFKEFNIWARKEYGQNFLVDPNMLRFIVRSGSVGPEDFVIDVGAGTGLLTRLLAQKAWQVWGVEIDRRIFDFCSAYTSGIENVQLLHQDMLKDKNHIEPRLEARIEEILTNNPDKNLKIVSNLPYNISTLLIPILLEGTLPMKLMVLTVQKEVGDRLVAVPGTKDYGSLSVIVQACAKAEVVRVLPNNVFWPRPKVDSALVRIVPNRRHLDSIEDYDWFKLVTRALFSSRRKMSINSMRKYEGFPLGSDCIETGLLNVGLDPKHRGEVFSVEQIIELSNELWKMRQNP